MKKNVPLFLFFVLAVNLIYSQDLNVKIQSLKKTEVPNAVLVAQQKLFPNNYVSNWKLQKLKKIQDVSSELYISNFEEDGKIGFSASYLPNGILIFETEFMESEIIPNGIKIKMLKDYKNHLVQSADFITLPTPHGAIYMIKLLDRSVFHYAFYDIASNEIKKEDLPLEIFLLLD